MLVLLILVLPPYEDAYSMSVYHYKTTSVEAYGMIWYTIANGINTLNVGNVMNHYHWVIAT